MIGRLSFDLLKDLSNSPEMEIIPFPCRLSESSLLTEGAVPAYLGQSEDVFVSGLEVRPDSEADLLLVSPVLTGV